MPGCELDVVIESKDWTCRVVCPCGFEGATHSGGADSAHDAALADRAAHVAGLPVEPAPPVEAGHDYLEPDLGRLMEANR